MADIKWIKITTDMFDNRKIKHLRRLPDGNNIVLIWVMLLTMAGRCNSSGMIFLTENIPYTPKMLADELDFEETTVQLALQALEQLGMICSYNGFVTIAGWETYQNIEGMEKIREQNRIRQKKWYDSQKELPNVRTNVMLTQPNAIEEDKEEDKEKNIKESTKRKRFVPPSLEEVSSFIKEKGYNVDPEEWFFFYSSKDWMVGKNKMSDWHMCVAKWNAKNNKDKPKKNNKFVSDNQRQYDFDSLEK